MFVVSIIALFVAAIVNGYTPPLPYSKWGQSCIQMTQTYPTNTRGVVSTGWKSVGKANTVITGYYKNMGGYYKKVDDINCVDIKDMKPMYFMKSGSKYYLNPTRSCTVSSAKYSNCYQTVETFPKAVCDAPGGNGPMPNRPMGLSIRTASASKCNTMWATTAYSDAVIVDTPSDWTSPIDDFDMDKVWSFDEDDVIDDNFDGDDDFEEQPQLDAPVFDEPAFDFEEQPYLKAPIFGDSEEQPQLDAPIFDEPAFNFEEQPKISAPIIGQPEPASNTFTVTIGKWSLLIIALVMANFAVIMTLMYCREKNKGSTKFTQEF